MGVADIEVDDFKTYFTRGFTYGTQDECGNAVVTDDDITMAYGQAKFNFNEGLFSTQEQLKIAFLHLAAHFVCTDRQMASEGLNSQSSFAVNSRSVGSVSESYQIPDWVSKSPVFAALATTRYGLKYLTLIRPRMIGAMTVFQGATTP
jgi:hypothetical protein